MFCNQCGKELKEGALFCTSCGAKQTPEDTADDFDRTMIIDSNHATSETESKSAETEPIQQSYPNGNYVNYGFQQNVNNQPGFNQTQGNTGYQQPPMYPNNPSYDDATMRMGAPHIGVSFGEAIKLFFTNYVNFKGRASKSEYWWVFLFNVLVNIPNYILSVIVPPVSGLISLALIIPGLALYVRRMHDIGKHWYRMFIGLIPIAGIIIMIIDLCKDSEGDNEWGYGPDHN